MEISFIVFLGFALAVFGIVLTPFSKHILIVQRKQNERNAPRNISPLRIFSTPMPESPAIKSAGRFLAQRRSWLGRVRLLGSQQQNSCHDEPDRLTEDDQAEAMSVETKRAADQRDDGSESE
jgi:hypothetical protein